jgi:hypothetical protein
MKRLMHVTVAAVAVLGLVGCIGKGKGKVPEPVVEQPVFVPTPEPIITKG